MVTLPLSRAAGMIQDEDLLLYRSGGLLARMISHIGKGRDSHAVCWHAGATICL